MTAMRPASMTSKGARMTLPPSCGTLADGGFDVVDRDVEHPVRRHSLLALIGAQRVTRSGVAAIELENRVDLARPHGIVVGSPSKNCTVEFLGGVLVGGARVQPSKMIRRDAYRYWSWRRNSTTIWGGGLSQDTKLNYVECQMKPTNIMRLKLRMWKRTAGRGAPAIAICKFFIAGSPRPSLQSASALYSDSPASSRR